MLDRLFGETSHDLSHLIEFRMDVSIIIVNWNSAEFVRQCLESIFANTRKVSFEVLVVDSGSFDGCGSMVANEFPKVRFIQSEENVGFARANNFAFKHAQGRNILFLNPDTKVLGAAVEILSQTLDRLPDAGAVGCRLLNGDGSLQTSCIQSFPTVLNQILNSEWLRRHFPRSALWGMAPLFSDEQSPSEVEAISGACLMIKREACAAIGGFSVDYFMYSEDLDLCYKSFKTGYKNYYVATASVIHYGDGSVSKARTDFAVVMAADALRRFFSKHRGPTYALFYRASLAVAAVFRLILLALGLLRQKKCRIGLESSVRRWKAILRWAIGCEHWIADYQS